MYLSWIVNSYITTHVISFDIVGIRTFGGDRMDLSHIAIVNVLPTPVSPGDPRADEASRQLR